MNFIVVVGLIILADLIALVLLISAMIAHTLDAWRPSTRCFTVAVATAVFIPQFAIGEPFRANSLLDLCVTALLITCVVTTVLSCIIGFADYQREHAQQSTATQPLNLSKLTPVK